MPFKKSIQAVRLDSVRLQGVSPSVWTLLGLFLLSRAGLRAAGFEFRLDLGWMFLADPAELRQNLSETLLYFHAFPPGMNLLTGGLLQAGPGGLESAAPWVFALSGLVLLLSLFRLLQRLGLSQRLSALVAAGFSLAPATLYFENLYLYTYPCAALLTLGVVLFERAVRLGTWRSWACCFLVGAALGWLRTTFHLVWFALMLVLAIALAASGKRRAVWLGALAPAVLLVAIYAKNLALFGFFGTTSWSGANLTLATTQRMPPRQRQHWIETGILSPYAGLSVFAPPRDYLRLSPQLRNQPHPWPGSNELWRPSVRAPNYNHGLFLEVNRQRRVDALAFIRSQPEVYARTVLQTNLPAFFSGSTHWHPGEGKPGAPHLEHRRVLGSYEAAYERLVHSWPTRGVGLYWFLLPVALWAAGQVLGELRAALRLSRRPWLSPRGLLLLLCLVQVGFVATVSVLMTAQESSRYRFVVEPCVWALGAAALLDAWRRAWSWFRGGTRRPSAAGTAP